MSKKNNSRARSQYSRLGLQSKKLFKTELNKKFQKLGFKIVKMNQHFRNAYGVVESEGEQFFFKIASSRSASIMLNTEIEFNLEIARRLKRRESSFAVPEIIDDGWFGSQHYYIAELLSAKPIAPDYPKVTRGLGKWLDDIIEINLYLSSVRGMQFSNDRHWQRIKHRAKKYMGMVKSWANIAKLQNVRPIDDLFEIASELYSVYEPALAHGDFSAKHIFYNEEKLFLIDSELASSFHPRFYDVAHFYHRVFTSSGSRSLARSYATRFRKELSRRQKELFDKCMLPIVAARTIGSFCELAADKSKKSRIPYYLKISKDILRGDLYD